MRRSVIVLMVLFLGIAAGQVPAQQQQVDENESSLFVTTLYINRVQTHRLGYRVLYQRGDLSLGEAYIPSAWFRSAAGKAELIRTSSRAAPYMEVYYSNGEFAHVRLYVRRSPDHISWGSVPAAEATEDNFNQEALNISY